MRCDMYTYDLQMHWDPLTRMCSHVACVVCVVVLLLLRCAFLPVPAGFLCAVVGDEAECMVAAMRPTGLDS